jgi:hypothetical protein
MVDESLRITYKFNDWEDPVIPMQCEFSLVNEKTDFFELLPLMIAEEREYKIRVLITSPTSYTAFDGYLNCEPVSQKYLHRQTIDFVASNYLMKLEDVHPVSIDTLQNKTFIDVINEILLSTGSNFPVRVNSLIHAEGDIPTSGQTLFNLNGFFTELFWEDNVERTTSLDILTTILRTFNCYIYWWQNYWYIERYVDLWGTSIDYVEYASGATYAPTGAGSVVNKTFITEDLNDNVFTGRSQTLRAEPGMKVVKITLNDVRYLNLVKTDFLTATYVYTDFPEPNYREWLVWGQTGLTWGYGFPKSEIASAFSRSLLLTQIDVHRGIYCKFKTTIVSSEDQLNISFKYCFSPDTIFEWTGNVEDYSFKFHWYLRVLPNYDYIRKSGDEWNVYSVETEASWVQEIEIFGDQFDPETNVVTVNIDIPLGVTKDFRLSQDNGYLRGDQVFVLCIGSEKLFTKDEDNNEVLVLQPEAWFGDIYITTTGKDQDNVIEGTTNTKYLNKLDIGLDLYDAETFDYENAILRGTDLEKRTLRWGTTGGSTEVVARGVCWSSTNNPPTLADSFSEEGTGFGTFESQLYNLTQATLYYYRAYATDALGNTEYGDTKSFTSEILAVGHKYMGGIIGYIFVPGDAGYVVGEVHGIIVSIEDQNTRVVWGRLSGGGPYTCGAYGFEIGDGAANTAAIEANTFQNDFAIRTVVDYTYQGFTDWFLPSIVELIRLHTNRIILGLAKDWYWSSTEEPGSWKLAWAVNMGGSVNGGDTWKKNNYMRVRACRYF